MTKTVFVAFVEVKPLPGCEIDPEEINGACVRCYVAEENEEGAIFKIKSELSKDFFKIINIEWCVDFYLTEWENPNNKEGDELVKNAMETGNVIYGEFHVWGHDAPDAID